MMKSMMWDLTECIFFGSDDSPLFRYLHYETGADTSPPNVLFAVIGACADRQNISVVMSEKESLERAIEAVLKYSHTERTKAHIKKTRKFLCFHDHELVPETAETIRVSEISLRAYRVKWISAYSHGDKISWQIHWVDQLVGEDFLAVLVDGE
jgi:hypothetical protein